MNPSVHRRNEEGRRLLANEGVIRVVPYLGGWAGRSVLKQVAEKPARDPWVGASGKHMGKSTTRGRTLMQLTPMSRGAQESASAVG